MNSGRRASLDRLRGRSLAELATRGAQFLSVLMERVGGGDTREPTTRELYDALVPEVRERHPTFSSWLNEFRHRGGTGFFAGFGQMSETARLAHALDPVGVARVIAQADQAVDGRLTILGHRNMDVGRDIDWHRDPLLDVSAPRLHWTRIPYLDPRVAGDHKLVWEINRHQWLVTLGQAWVYTGDGRYVTAIANAMRSWMDANAPKRGVNWASSLEMAFRAISWVWVFRLVGHHPQLPDALVGRAVGHLRIAARHITRHLSTYFSANTHLTGEALALYYLGGELRGLRDAERWRETGRAILLEQLPIHVRSDGTYFEQSTWYHRYTLDFYLHFCLLEAQTEGREPVEVRGALERLAEVLMWVTRPDGTMPLLGDDDGGRLLMLDGRAASDAHPALANVAALLGHATLASVGKPSSELVWLLGREGVDRLAGLRPQPPLDTSRHFSAGGLVVLRDGWGAAASVMTVDAGVHGVMNGGHAHADALAFDLTIRGQPVFVDPGTCDYTTDPATRDRFRHTTSHNAVSVDGDASSEMTGPFAWGETASTSLGAFVTTPAVDYLDAAHDGFLRRPARARYRRQIVFLRHGVWILRDSIHAEQACRIDVHLQCAVGLTATIEHGQVRVAAGDRPVVAVHVPDEQTTLVTEVGFVAPLYGTREAAPHVVISRGSASRHVVHTVISAADLDVRSVHVRREGEASVLEVHRGEEMDVVGFGAGAPLRYGDLLVDADIWVMRRGRGGEVTHWEAAGCRQLERAGERLSPSAHGSDVWGTVERHTAALETD